MKQSIYRFKDGGRREYAEFYAKESARLYGDWIKRKDIQAIIPIPIHRHKRYKRGYNQAEVYAKELGKQCGLPIDSKTLIRVVDTLPQKTLSDRERKNNLKKALKIGVDGVQWKRVLVVDDEKLIVKGIRFSLEQDGMEVDCAYDGEEALKMATENAYDMILLDIMLPKMDGFEVCQHIREFSNMPIVMLTAKGDDMDKILGLEYGADDYITKPFNILEVKARIKAIMRRTAASQPRKEESKMIEAGDLKLDCESRRLFILGREVNLTAKEFDLLELLVNNPNKVYGRENLLNLVWGYEYPGDVRTVDVHVRRLREKIESNPSEPKYVHTKWGVGYYYSQN